MALKDYKETVTSRDRRVAAHRGCDNMQNHRVGIRHMKFQHGESFWAPIAKELLRFLSCCERNCPFFLKVYSIVKKNSPVEWNVGSIIAFNGKEKNTMSDGHGIGDRSWKR